MSFASVNKLDLDGADLKVYDDKEGGLYRGDAGVPTFSSARTAKLLRKMDFNIVPFLALLYL